MSCKVDDGSIKISFFSTTLIFSLMDLGLHAKHLKIQLCPPLRICFEFGPSFLFAFILVLHDFFYFPNFITFYLI